MTVAQGVKRGIRLTFEDAGPGIADVSLALKDGYTTGRHGARLSGSKRLVNALDIAIKLGERTQPSPHLL